MSKKYDFNLVDLNEGIDNRIIGITKCYLLINYAFNTEENNDVYKTEFKKRYLNFYRALTSVDHDLDDLSLTSNPKLFKQLLGLDYYIPTMSFLESEDINTELEEENDIVDIDFEVKAAMSSVKLNFYHNNNVEFGNNTRFHVETDKYSTINPKAKTSEEKKYIFEALTNFYKNNFLNKNNKKLTKDM